MHFTREFVHFITTKIFKLNLEILTAFVGATAVLAMSPGPDNIYVLTQSISNGKKYGFATIAGLISGCLIHITLLAFGVSAIIKENNTLFFTLKIFGAMYLLFLAFQVFRSSSNIKISESGSSKKGLIQLFKQGFVMNVLNPKVSIFFLAFFPGFLFSQELSTTTQFYVLGFLFMLVSALIFAVIVLLSDLISKYIRTNNNVGLFLKWLQIIVFVGIAVYLLLSDK